VKVLIREVRMGRMSPKMSWRREDGIGSMGHVGWDGGMSQACDIQER